MHSLLLWDWNSLESVRDAHNSLEGWALVFFALLVVFDVLAHLADEPPPREKMLERIGLWCFGIAVLAEIVAYPYGRRNDTLSKKQDSEQRGRISDLDNSTQKLRTDAQQSKERADALEAGLISARQKSDQFKIEATEKQQALATELDDTTKLLGKTKTELVDLAVCSSPRIISFSMFNGKFSTDPLKPFAGTSAAIEVVPGDAESRRAASQIEGSLKGAGWNVTRSDTDVNVKDGVDVERYVGPLALDGHGRDDANHSTRAADAVVAFLHSYDWQATEGIVLTGNAINHEQSSGIKIRVGLYPSVAYVPPPADAEFQRAIAASAKAGEEARRKQSEAYAAIVRRSREKLSPEQRRMIEESDRQFEKQRKTEDEKREAAYKNPCQPLTP